MLNVNINLHGCWIHILLNHKVKETAAKKFLLPEFDVAFHFTGCSWNTRITDVALSIAQILVCCCRNALKYLHIIQNIHTIQVTVCSLMGEVEETVIC